MSEVKVVCNGFLRREDGMVVEAHSTVTLVLSGAYMIVVDTSSPQYRRRIVEELEMLDIDPLEIDLVVNTHLHHDHCANNDLFPRAKFMVHANEDPGPGFQVVTQEGEIRPGIRLIHTPGHTRGSMSVVVEAEDARYVLAGDALPTKDNYEKWVPPGINYDEGVALSSMERIVELAEIVVPGHGPPFPVVPRLRR